MIDFVIANFETLMLQAPMTAEVYLTDCVESIDKEFGEGYAKKNPELVCGMLRACSQDYTTGVISKTAGLYYDSLNAMRVEQE